MGKALGGRDEQTKEQVQVWHKRTGVSNQKQVRKGQRQEVDMKHNTRGQLLQNKTETRQNQGRK